MTLSKGVLKGRGGDPLFIGWAKTPAVYRRFLLGAVPVSLAATGGIAFVMADNLADPGAGSWQTGATHEVTGALARAPYPMIRVEDPSSPFGVRTILVVAEGKCTSDLDLAASAGQLVKASGVLIERGTRQMLEVPLGLNTWWLDAVPEVQPLPALVDPEPVSVGEVALAGTIMDSKCFFGVMRPGRGRTHKACASLCIRGGIPPSFWVRMKDGRESVLLMTDRSGGPLKDEILPLVAEPSRVRGEIVRVGDLLHLRADASDYSLA